MRNYLKKIMSLVLCLTLCIGMSVPASAANENNTLGVTFSVSLETPSITASNIDQTVVMHLTASEGITMDGMGLQITNDSALTLTSISGGEDRISLTGANYNLENGRVSWSSDDGENISGVTDMLTATFTVPANTPAGTYEVGIQDLELTKNYGSVIWENSATATASLTVKDESVTEGYTAGMTTLTNTVSVNDTIIVNIGVSHSSDSTFAAGEVVLSYDNALLTFNQNASTLGNATVKDEAGVLTLEDYGVDKNFGTGVYVLAFDAISNGNTTMDLTSAGFVDKENAVKSDLIEAAALSPSSIQFTINKKQYDVTLPEIFIGPASVTDGEDYTFSVADGENYDYHSISATMDGESVAVIDNSDGTYTIENVTGELVITGTRTEKTYTVTYSGNAADDIKDGASTATYNTDYTFTMPAADGWAYHLDSLRIGGKDYSGYTVENNVYTIPGTAINGNIEITVSKSATESSVTVEGSGAGAASGYDPVAVIGQDYTLTIVPEAGYTYTVSATMDGEPVEVTDNGDNTYTIHNVSGNIVFTVDRTVIVDGVSAAPYLTLDGTRIWIVKNNISIADGKVPTYDGQAMFWSDKYNAYCFLVIADTLDSTDVAANIDIADGVAVNVNYNMDVNITGKADASDAQLVYNMYNALYTEFTSDATIEKFLRADVNGDSTINVEDAAAIINYLVS